MSPMSIGFLTQLQASALYLIPVAVVVLWLSGRKTFLADLIMWIPGAIALDLLVCLLICWVLPLDVVLVGSRVLWFGLGIEILRRRHWRITWTEKPTWGQLAVVMVTGVAAFLLSASISRPGSPWDRPFHIPLVTMMRHQRLPFLNVFQHETVLHYHFAGDVIAAALQTFSWGRMHSSISLALMHDLIFALVGVSVAAWLATFSRRRLWIIPGVLAILLSGPFALQRMGMGSHLGGYSFLNLLCMSYRPGIVAAILFLVGGMGALLLRLFDPRVSPRMAMAVIFLCTAALAISDEPSAGLLGIGVGAVWLVHPSVLPGPRKVGIAILMALAATVIVSNLIFQAALVPGGPVQKLDLVAFRSPGYSEPPLSLGTGKGLYALLLDLAPFLLILAAAVGASWGQRGQPVWRMTVALAAILFVGVLGLTVVDMGGMHIENHRFMTICEVVFPLAALVLLTRLPEGRWERIPLIGALLIPAVSSFYWAQYGVGDPDAWFTNAVDCRKATGAVLFEKPRPTYLPPRSLYAFSGCRPVFVPGTATGDNNWSGRLLNGYPSTGRGAFELLHSTFVRPNESLRAACSAVTDDADPVCTFAKNNGRCTPAGDAFLTCELTTEDRARLLSTAW